MVTVAAMAAAVLMAHAVYCCTKGHLLKEVQVAHCQHNNHECKTVHVYQT